MKMLWQEGRKGFVLSDCQTSDVSRPAETLFITIAVLVLLTADSDEMSSLPKH